MDPEYMSDALDDLADDAREQELLAQQAEIFAEFRKNFGDDAAMAMLRQFCPSYQPTPEQARGIREHLHAAGIKLQGDA